MLKQPFIHARVPLIQWGNDYLQKKRKKKCIANPVTGVSG